MPVGMMRLTTATPESLEQFRDDPEGLYNYVKEVVERAGAEFLNLFFDIGRERAYVLIKDLDDYVRVKAVARILGAEGFLKMVEKEQAIEAIALETEIRPPLS
jgi:hypothetical protein